MALYPNGRHMTRSTYKGYGTDVGLAPFTKGLGDRMNRFLALDQTASTPDGYGMKGYVPPITAGSMSALRSVATMGEGTSNLLQGGPMEGTAAVIDWTQDGGLSLVVGLSANSAIATLTGNNLELKLTIGLNGTAEWTLTGTPNLSMIVPFEGTGNVVTLSGTSDLRGLLSMTGEWTPFAELSPESLAAAVWNSIASQYNDAGTMGEKLNGAGSAGNPWTEVIESGYTAEEILRLVASSLLGVVSGADTENVTFKGLDGTTDRISATVDSNGNRLTVTLDGN